MVGGDGARITFPDYPGRETVQEQLKAAGFHWSRPSWYGKADRVPESVRALVEPDGVCLSGLEAYERAEERRP